MKEEIRRNIRNRWIELIFELAHSEFKKYTERTEKQNSSDNNVLNDVEGLISQIWDWKLGLN